MLAEVLRRLGPTGLIELLQRRPDAVAGPIPRSLVELSERLGSIGSTAAALRLLDRPALQVAETLAALGGSASIDTLTRLLGASPERPLQTLRDLLLLTDAPDPTLATTMMTVWPRPLGLGPSVSWTLAPLTLDNLQAIAGNLGLSLVGRRKSEILHEITSALATPSIVLDVVSKAPDVVSEELHKAAQTGEPIETHTYGYYYSSWTYRRRSGAQTTDIWGLDRGMLALDPHTSDLVVAAEVALALRGPAYLAPFDPEPPAVDVVKSDSTPDGVGMAASFGRTVIGLLDSAGRTPLTPLKGGGMGVREIGRLAKELRCTEAEVRLALAVAVGSGLLGGMVPSSLYDDFLQLSPAQRLAALLRVWWLIPQVPTGITATWSLDQDRGIPELRATLIRYATGQSIADPESVARRVVWEKPYGYGPAATAEDLVAAAWHETSLVGAVANGQSTLIGQALLHSPDDLESLLASVGSSQTQVRLQADLTAVVSGTPTPELAGLLNSAAVLETRGDASTWRFSPASVRTALDSGLDAPTLLASLAEVARDGVPQALEYLINDIARTHGSIRVAPVTCCLRSDDTALLAAVVADRKLQPLGLRLLAPTVLASSSTSDEVLRALRTAGYAPVLESADGMIALQPPQARRTAATPIVPAPRSEPVDFAALAASLLATPDATGSPSTLASLTRYLNVGRREAEILAQAIDHEQMVQIVYVRRDGARSVRVISDVQVLADSLSAWCHLRQEERWFKLHNIKAVLPIEGE